MRCETTSMKSWQKSDWKIIPHYVPYLNLASEPAAPLIDLLDLETQKLVTVGKFEFGPSAELDEDVEDFLDARATEIKYQTVGIKGFRSYREYRERRLQEK